MTDTPKKTRKPSSKINLIEDPYGFSTLEISEAQSRDEELELDEIRDEEGTEATAETATQDDSDAALEKLAETIQQAVDEEERAEAEADAGADVPDAQTELAAQIAEDQALQAQEK